jgi:AmmeMemoRadiSam system protein A
MSQPVTLQLTEFDQKLLLQIARNAVGLYLASRKPHIPQVSSEALNEQRGMFVSLHQGNELRGCIGNVYPVSPLYRSAAECAIAAAVGDPRFMPLSALELASVSFEISVLSPLQHVTDIEEIEVGRHGLLIGKRNRHGLLLPQVAALYGWDRERFLRETCKKAGLHPDAWQNGSTIQSFTALVFHEDPHGLTHTLQAAPSEAPQSAQ